MTNSKQLLGLGFLTAALLGTAGTAMAQESDATSSGLDDTTSAQQDVGSTGADRDDTATATGGGPVVSSTGVSTTTWPRFEHISCRKGDEGLDGSGAVHPGITHSGMPGHPVFPGYPTFNDDIRCSLHSEYGLVYYRCTCGDERNYLSGNLDKSWFNDRPLHEQRVEGCKEVLSAQCGNVSVPAKASCSNDYGSCNARAFVRDDDKNYSILNFQCRCIDQTGWSSRQRVDAVVAPNAMQLQERCEIEVARCGREGVGQAGAGLLGMAPERRLDASCDNPFGNCVMQRNANAPDTLSCGCRGGERKNLSGDMGWKSSSISEILSMCKSQIDTCKPAGSPDMSGESVPAGGSTGGSVATNNATSTGGANAGVVSGGKEPRVQCAMTGGSGRFGYAFFAGLALLGWRRRRN